MSTVRYFRWDDPGAPTLTGEVGSLTNLLRKCLVGTAGTAYGSKAAAGWSEQFVGAAANVAVFKNNEAEGGSGCFVKVVDNGSGAGGAREAALTAYAMMTDIGTGVNPSKTPFLRKSSTANNLARRWIVVADGLTAWIYLYKSGLSAVVPGEDASFGGFGDYACVADANSFRYFALGRLSSNVNGGDDIMAFYGSALGNKSGALSAPNVAGIGAAVDLSVWHPPWGGLFGVGNSNYPDISSPVTGDAYVLRRPRVFVDKVIYGALRGLAIPLFNAISLPPAEAITGSVGDVLVVSKAVSSSNPAHAEFLILDTVGPW